MLDYFFLFYNLNSAFVPSEDMLLIKFYFRNLFYKEFKFSVEMLTTT